MSIEKILSGEEQGLGLDTALITPRFTLTEKGREQIASDRTHK